MRVVLDTNVIVSAYITASPTSPPRAILHRWRAGEFQLVVCGEVLREYVSVLTRPWCEKRHGLSYGTIARNIEAIRRMADVVQIDGTEGADVPRDPDDAVFVACAIAGAADVIVSGDRHLLDLHSIRGIPIIPLVVFVAMLDSGEP